MNEITNSSDIVIFLQNYFKQYGKQIEPTQDLFECGALDSIGVMELVAFIEESLCFSFVQDSMQIDNFRSIESISKTILRSKSTVNNL